MRTWASSSRPSSRARSSFSRSLRSALHAISGGSPPTCRASESGTRTPAHCATSASRHSWALSVSCLSSCARTAADPRACTRSTVATARACLPFSRRWSATAAFCVAFARGPSRALTTPSRMYTRVRPIWQSFLPSQSSLASPAIAGAALRRADVTSFGDPLRSVGWSRAIQR